MNDSQTGQGLLMIVVGVWVIARTVTKDTAGQSLVDKILGKNSTSNAAAATAVGSGTSATTGSAASQPTSTANVQNTQREFSNPFAPLVSARQAKGLAATVGAAG